MEFCASLCISALQRWLVLSANALRTSEGLLLRKGLPLEGKVANPSHPGLRLFSESLSPSHSSGVPRQGANPFQGLPAALLTTSQCTDLSFQRRLLAQCSAWEGHGSDNHDRLWVEFLFLSLNLQLSRALGKGNNHLFSDLHCSPP